MLQLDSKAGLDVFTGWFKPALYNAGAAPTLGDGSARVGVARLKLAAEVLQAHNLFGFKFAHNVDAAMTNEEFRKHFGHRLKTVLNMADKVAFYSAAFKRG